MKKNFEDHWSKHAPEQGRCAICCFAYFIS